jgi:signal transduction histidine kinase
MSHELRTPLNSAILGLKLLLNEVQSSRGHRDAEHVDTVTDVSKSVMAAVDILDSLLCYDKLESGMLELRKQEIKLVEFLNDCISPFAPQARECGTALRLIRELAKSDADNDKSGEYYLFAYCPYH